jgi:hypothetical protein
VSRRARLPGAEELFRSTAPRRSEPPEEEPSPTDDKSSRLQVAKSTTGLKKRKHDEKITFYCTAEDVLAVERARLALRGEHGVSADRGRIVRAALAYVLEDFEARGGDSVLVHELARE